MEKHEQLLNMLMDFNEDVRFAAVCNKDGDILWNSQRTNLRNAIPLNETKKTLKRALGAWDERSKITDNIGRGMYVIAAYEKIKRITIPLNGGNLLFVSVDNSPKKAGKGKSYGHLAQMGKMMSIVDFINENK